MKVKVWVSILAKVGKFLEDISCVANTALKDVFRVKS